MERTQLTIYSHFLCIIYKEKSAILYTFFHGSARSPLQKQLAWCLGLKEIEECRKVLGLYIFFTHHLNISLYIFHIFLCIFVLVSQKLKKKIFIHHLNLSLYILLLSCMFVFVSKFFFFKVHSIDFSFDRSLESLKLSTS